MTADQLSFDDVVRQRNAILWLINQDPKNSAHVRAIAATIAHHVHPGAQFSANDIRQHLPTWIKPCVIGPTFGMLAKRRALQFCGYEPSTQRRTHGKPVAVWRVTP